MSRGFPAFFRQFWLHFMKNFRKNLKAERLEHARNCDVLLITYVNTVIGAYESSIM